MKDPKRPSNTTTTTTSFFFKGRPKQVLSEVKKVLEISDDDGEEEGEGEGDSQEEVATPVQIPASKQPKVTVEVIDLCEEEKVTPEKRKILPEVMKKYKLRVETPKESFPKQPQTINSSPMMDSCPPVRVTIHDERSSKEGEYLVPSASPIWTAYKQYCKQCKLSPYSMILLYGDVRVFISATPTTLGIIGGGSLSIRAIPEEEYRRRESERKNIRDAILGGGSITTMPMTEEEPQTNNALITLTLKAASRDPFDVKINLDAPLQSILPDIRRHFSLSTAHPIKLIFDGSVLSLINTPSNLGLEDEDLLELRI